MRTSAIFGAVRHLAGDDGRAQGPLRPIIGRFDPWVGPEAPHVAPVVMPAEFSEPPLVVRIFQAAITPRIRELRLQRLGLNLEVSHGGDPVLMPQRQRGLQHGLERCPALPGPAPLLLHNVAERAQDRRQALLLPHPAPYAGAMGTPPRPSSHAPASHPPP